MDSFNPVRASGEHSHLPPEAGQQKSRPVIIFSRKLTPSDAERLAAPRGPGRRGKLGALHREGHQRLGWEPVWRQDDRDVCKDHASLLVPPRGRVDDDRLERVPLEDAEHRVVRLPAQR